MKSIVFDSSTIISLATNNLLWVLEGLKKDYSGDFIISEEVRREIIDVPIRGKKFKLEAIQILELIDKGVLKIVSKQEVRTLARRLSQVANTIFVSKNKPIKIVHMGEMEGLALAQLSGSEAYVIDERTTRLLIESPKSLLDLLNKKFHRKITINEGRLDKFMGYVKGVRILRSAEMMLVAYEKGLLKRYELKRRNLNYKKELVEGILWGVRLRGCAISTSEIKGLMSMEGF